MNREESHDLFFDAWLVLDSEPCFTDESLEADWYTYCMGREL